MAEPIRILIADDHTIVRSGVRMLLESQADMTVVGEALDGQQAVTLAESLRPDLVLMDIAMPGMNGLEATRILKQQAPSLHVLVLTMNHSDEYFFEILKAGAAGYVLKAAEPGELINAVRTVYRGDVFLQPAMTRKLLQDYLLQSGQQEPAHPPLSSREKEILILLAEGFDAREIAARMVVSPSTVYTHRGNLMNKLGLSSRHELVQYAQERGLLKRL